MSNTKKSRIRSRVQQAFKYIFVFGWTALLLSSARLVSDPKDEGALLVLVISIMPVVLSTLELKYVQISENIVTYIWQKIYK